MSAIEIPAFNDISGQTAVAAELTQRAIILHHAGLVATQNIAIAQHKDTQQYARRHGGGYVPVRRQFQPGDFVFVSRQAENVFSPATRKDILCIKTINRNGTVILEGWDLDADGQPRTCTRHVTKLAPCHAEHLERPAPAIITTSADVEEDIACSICGNTTPEDTMLLCDGCRTGWHTTCLQPPLTAIPHDDWFCPTCQPPADTNSEPLAPGRQATSRRRSPRLATILATQAISGSWTPATWSYASTDSLQHLLQQLMPGTWDHGHVTRLHSKITDQRAQLRSLDHSNSQFPTLPTTWAQMSVPEARTLSRLSPLFPVVMTMPSEIHQLLDTVSFNQSQSIVDPWSGLGTIRKTFAQAGHMVHCNDLHPNACADEHSDALLYDTYANWKHDNNLEVIVTSPHFTFLDIALPLAAGMVRDVACVHCPSHYFFDATRHRLQYFAEMERQGRLHLITHLPHGPLGRRCMWICVFRTTDIRMRMLRSSGDTGALCTLRNLATNLGPTSDVTS
jgi:hypothetical protein